MSFNLSDFDMSDSQLEHAFMVERLSPRLAALRIELCPTHMSEGSFWRTYFVLLHPRLSKRDAELLSTPQVGYFDKLFVESMYLSTIVSPYIKNIFPCTVSIINSYKFQHNW